MATQHYNFGVEIEAVVKPYGVYEAFNGVDWRRQLAEKLDNRGIAATYDDDSRYSKHPEYYNGKWFVTRDGSLKRNAPYGKWLVVYLAVLLLNILKQQGNSLSRSSLADPQK